MAVTCFTKDMLELLEVVAGQVVVPLYNIFKVLKYLNFTLFLKNYFCLVSGCAADNNPVCGHRGRNHDVRLPDLHPEPRVLALGRILHRLHRDRGAGLHDLLGHQP